MARGNQKGFIDSTFLAQANALAEQSGAIGDASVGNGQRPWQTGSPAGWTGNPLDIPGIGPAWSRDVLGQAYADCLSNVDQPGSTASTLALKLQSEWLAMQERSFRLRHASSVRCALQSAGRRKAHADGKGVILTGVVKYVEDIIKRGA